MLTAFLIAWPLLSVLFVYLSGAHYAKRTALGSTIIQLAATLYAVFMFQQNADVQFALDVPWLPTFGTRFSIGMDGISMLMVLLTNLMLPLIVLSSFRTSYSRPGIFYSLMLIMQAALVGVFVSMDAFLYYIFWELALIPIYFIVLFWGGDERVKITFKFFIYTLFGSLFMLIGIIYLYMQVAAPSNFSYEAFRTLSLSRDMQTWIFFAFFIAFAIKMPIFPFHTWQPDTYTTAPPQGTMLLSGIMLKMGTYSVIRWILPIVPQAVLGWEGKIAIVLSVIGIVYASWIALTQKDIKRLFAYSSIAHVGLIAAGIFTLTLQGLQGGLIQMLSHGINVVGLFFIAQIIFDRTQTHDIRSLGGIVNKAPLFATLFMVVMLGSVALPLTNGFIGEFLLLSASFQYSPILAGFAGLTIILGAVYMLRAYQHSVLGETKEGFTFADLYTSERIVLIVIVGLIIFIGIYPKPFLNMTEPAVKNILDGINSSTSFSLK